MYFQSDLGIHKKGRIWSANPCQMRIRLFYVHIGKSVQNTICQSEEAFVKTHKRKLLMIRIIRKSWYIILHLEKRRRKYILNRHEKQMEYKEHERILECSAGNDTIKDEYISQDSAEKRKKVFDQRSSAKKSSSRWKLKRWSHHNICWCWYEKYAKLEDFCIQRPCIFIYMKRVVTWNRRKKIVNFNDFFWQKIQCWHCILWKKKNKEKNVKGFFFPVTENVETSA